MARINDNAILETRLVGDIVGHFHIPGYQRGYRWTKREVRRLLDDIYESGSDNPASQYCLQPIVVKNLGEEYELIDGQQRLTTLFLIYKYMQIRSGGFLIENPRFSLSYETRAGSADFLNNLDLARREESSDFYFIANAYETIESWFDGKKQSVITDINSLFDKKINVIWYEVGSSEDGRELFTRLNIGKIPLTNSELVKALFLSNETNDQLSESRQNEIALAWDSMERELHDDSLWYFLSNARQSNVQTRMDLVLDLIAGKESCEIDPYYSFFMLDRMRQERSLLDIWEEICVAYMMLKDWYEDHDLYHLIGYLIASNVTTLQTLYQTSIGLTKTGFADSLKGMIKDSLKSGEDYASYSYETAAGQREMLRLLLLFNIESVRQLGDVSHRFPFDKHKANGGCETKWSLEHIHAQQSEGLRTEGEWREWLEKHKEFVIGSSEDPSLYDDISKALDASSGIGGERFNDLQVRVLRLLSEKGNVEYLHSLSNMALLNTGDNAALNNSVFAVKRDIIVNLDKHGSYIPFCTKMVFLKYYTPSKDGSFLFWGQKDRIEYINAMNEVLAEYLPSRIPQSEFESGEMVDKDAL